MWFMRINIDMFLKILILICIIVHVLMMILSSCLTIPLILLRHIIGMPLNIAEKLTALRIKLNERENKLD